MKKITSKSVTPALIGAACLLTATASWGVTFDLKADEFLKTINGRQVQMWGFGLQSGAVSVPGPALTVPITDSTLIINLRNDLAVPISIVIPGLNGYVRTLNEHSTFQDTAVPPRTRARSFVKEVQPGQTVQYVWNGVTPGTYLYHSGSHPALQVQMGLYGMAKKNAPNVITSPAVYPGVAYGTEAVWIFGELDFEVHDAVQAGTYAAQIKSMLHSTPDIYLLNGEPYPIGQQVGQINVGGGGFGVPRPTLIRMLNTCFDERIPVMPGYYLSVIAEDGKKYPYAKTENAVNLPSLKTRDALLTAGPGTYKFYDRRLLTMQ